MSLLAEYMAVTGDSNITSCSSSNSSSSKDLTYQIVINILVFITVSGISSVVDPDEFKKSFRNPPIYAGASFQFLLMPFIGFITVMIFPFDTFKAVTLLILTASPGGSFSNWWCNLFNADLALSVSMTSLSTVCSIGMLPLNILIYVTLAYERVKSSGVDSSEIEVNFQDLGITLGIVIGGIILGLLFGTFFPQYQNQANLVGNIAGLASIILGVFASSDVCDGQKPWQQPFFPLWIGTAFPLLFALLGTLFLGKLLGLRKEQRVAISLETAYQNTSIALAYTVSQGDLGRAAAGIPVIYGGYEAGFFLIFMVSSWKLGWTYAPSNEKLWKVLFENWQPNSENHRRLHPELYDVKVEDIEKVELEMKAKTVATEENGNGKPQNKDDDQVNSLHSL